MDTFLLLVLAGFETTANFIGNAILALLLHPEDVIRIHNRGSISDREMEELLRYSNVLSTPHVRWATADSEVGGVEVKRGDMVVAMMSAANRDPSIFENADQLDMQRANNPHMSFGHGLHYCIGAPLDRLEGKIVVGSIISRYPKLRLAVGLEELVKISDGTLRALKNCRLDGINSTVTWSRSRS